MSIIVEKDADEAFGMLSDLAAVRDRGVVLRLERQDQESAIVVLDDKTQGQDRHQGQAPDHADRQVQHL